MIGDCEAENIDMILICILGVAEEVIVIYLYLAILVAKLESQLHILTEGL